MHFVKQLRRIEFDLRATKQHGGPVDALAALATQA